MRGVEAVTITNDALSQTLDSSTKVLSVDVDREVNRVPSATIVVKDGRRSQRRFEVSESDFFAPGQPISISLRDKTRTSVHVFKGVVVRQALSYVEGDGRLTVELRDASVVLTQGRKSVAFAGRTDAQIISDIIGAAQNDSFRFVDGDSTEFAHPEMVQYRVSDWDFIVMRADANGLGVVVDDGDITLKKLQAGDVVTTVAWGEDRVFEFDFEADGVEQPPSVQAFAWDIENKSTTEPVTAADASGTPGNYTASAIAGDLGNADVVLAHVAPLANEEVTAWANARMARSRLSLVRGRLLVEGNAAFKPMLGVQLEGFSERVNGTALISGVRHTYLNTEVWRTELTLGLNPDPFGDRTDIAEPLAAGLVGPVRGLQVGVVESFAADDSPDDNNSEQLRVRLLLPGVEGGIVWARLAQPEAGKNRGYVFRPEKGDEVVVGFFNNDPRQAVILGAMFSSTSGLPAAIGDLTAENNIKGLASRKGIAVTFNDGDPPSLLLQTPGGGQILIQDGTEEDSEASTLSITDQHQNSIVMDKTGITITTNDLNFVVNAKSVEMAADKIDLKK